MVLRTDVRTNSDVITKTKIKRVVMLGCLLPHVAPRAPSARGVPLKTLGLCGQCP